MKNSIKLMGGMFLAVLFIWACNNEPKEDAQTAEVKVENTADTFLTSVESMDYEQAKKFCTDMGMTAVTEAADVLSDTTTYTTNVAAVPAKKWRRTSKPTAKRTITRKDVKDDKATVYYKIEGDDTERKLDLEKTGDDWKVVTTKEDVIALEDAYANMEYKIKMDGDEFKYEGKDENGDEVKIKIEGDESKMKTKDAKVKIDGDENQMKIKTDDGKVKIDNGVMKVK